MLEERKWRHESDTESIWELTLLDGTLKQTEPNLDHICTLAEWNAELMGRQNKHDPLLLLLKKFFTGDWRKKVGDKDEATELVLGMGTAIEKVPLQRVLRIIQELAQEHTNLAEKITKLREEIEKLTATPPTAESHIGVSSVNQLIDGLQASVEKMELAAKKAELGEDDKAEIAQELADFVYMLAKLKNAQPTKFPPANLLEELLAACGGFSLADAIKFCYYKYGSRLARDRVEFGKGKDKDREKIITVELIRRIEQADNNFDLSKIDISLVQRKMREILFQIIGAPERMVVTCDLTIHGKYNGKDVRLLIPRKQNFLYTDPNAGEAIAYSNFMTTGAVGNHEALAELLQHLPTGTVTEKNVHIINGYKIEKDGKVVRIQGIPTTNQAVAIDALTTLELGVQERGIINFNTDVIREAFIGLTEDETETTKVVNDINTADHSWAGYAEIVRKLIIDEDSPRLVQTVPAINNFKSGRTGINTHALLFRGELKVREATIKALIESGKAQYVDNSTEVVTAPILVIEAEKKSGVLAEMSARIDNTDRLVLDHSVVIGKPTFGENGPKIAISTNSLL